MKKLPAHVSRAEVDACAALLEELLSTGPMRPKDVRRVAAEHGLRVPHEAWSFAKRLLGVQTTHVAGPVCLWSLPAATLEAEIREWLDSPEGRFAAYLARRDRHARWPGHGTDTR